MKKTLVALAVLGSFAATASAQSSVTISGLVDLNVNKSIGTDDNAVGQASGSRLTFSGVEDLGGGLKASFELQHRLDASTGTQAFPNAFWRGGSWVGVSNEMGRVRLGRVANTVDATMGGYSPFGTDGVGSGGDSSSGGINRAFMNNAIAVDGSFAGVTINFQYGESNDNNDPGDNNPAGASIDSPYALSATYAAGPLAMSVAYDNTGLSAGGGGTWTVLAGSYDLGVAKISGLYGTGDNNTNGNEHESMLIGVSVPMGSAQILASYNTLEDKTAGVDVTKKISLGVRYSLSKRTRLYATVANDDAKASEKTGYEFGVRHTF